LVLAEKMILKAWGWAKQPQGEKNIISFSLAIFFWSKDL